MKLSLNRASLTGDLRLTAPGEARAACHMPVRKLATLLWCAFIMMLATGCASTKTIHSQQFITGKLPWPSCIWIYDFAATAAELPTNSVSAAEKDWNSAPRTAKESVADRQLGAEIASQLTGRVQGMGLVAFHAQPGMQPPINDLVIRGCLLSIKEGSVAKRVVVGFGAGGSELRTLVVASQMTRQGLRQLGFATVESGSNKAPGGALALATFLATANPAGLIVSGSMKVYGEASGRSKLAGRAEKTVKEISVRLKERFREQGWVL